MLPAGGSEGLGEIAANPDLFSNRLDAVSNKVLDDGSLGVLEVAAEELKARILKQLLSCLRFLADAFPLLGGD